MKLSIATLFSILVLAGCKKSPSKPSFTSTEQYAVAGGKIYNYKNPVQLIGTNALHVFSAGGSDMNNWHLDIAREFVGNMEQQPIMGNVLFDSNGTYLYPLQTIVDSNRANNRITILCPFGWNGKSSTVFSGLMPTQTYWWKDYKSKMAEWAAQFAYQPDVWIEVWNEPYRYDRSDGYTDDIWTSDMNSMVSIIRNAGNQNIVLVPCAEQGQDETVLNNNGNSFLSGKSNILFDIHAYEKWLLVPNSAMGSRLAQLQQNKLPIFFGETAPMNAGTLMNPAHFLDSVYNRGISVCAWVWKYDSTDQDALLTAGGQPNNTNNNNWGSIFQSLCFSPRKP
jgi:mannan endo-1,4-beta-mannosidase